MLGVAIFLESYDFSGKTLAAFATSGSGGMGGTDGDLKRICPDADWKPGRLLNRISDSELKKWIQSVL